MTLRLYNTLTRKIEPFQPADPPRVGIYGCGPTVYAPAHIGNFRTFLVFDLVHRYLAWRGYAVHFVMNLTDVDDKTIEAARTKGVSIREFTEPYVEQFLADADALGLRRFHLYPRATDYVDRMIELVERLLERELAYVTDDGSVFFDISRFPDYGKLARKDLDGVRQGERVSADEYGKEDVRDFALWKAAKPEDREADAVWEAPWGPGRPGWHLECSAMSLTEVGETLDLHLGGEDLIFPHHEDEIAQSEGATGKPFARHWLHVKHLRVDGSKMSKSLGNFFTVQELLAGGTDPAALRHLLLSAHYRSDLNFTRDGLEASGRAVRRLMDFRDRLAAHREAPPGEQERERTGGDTDGEAPAASLASLVEEADRTFRAAMDDDLNMAAALAAVFVFVKGANARLDRAAGSPLEPGEHEAASAFLSSVDRVLGLIELADRGRGVSTELEAWIRERVEAREAARGARDFTLADAIRAELQQRGVVLEDSPEGTRWKVEG